MRWKTLSVSRVFLAVLLALLLVFDVGAALLAGTPQRDLTAIGMVIGACFAQITVLAVAASMLPGRALIRMIAGVLTTLLVCAALGLHTRNARSPVPLVLAATAFCQWFIYQVPLWIFRFKGWSLDWQTSAEGQQGHEMQFGLKHIFIWTSVVATLLAIARPLTAFLAATAQATTSMDLTMFGILTLGNSVLMLPLIWGMFVRRHLWIWLLGSMVWALVVSPIQLYVISQSLPLAGSELMIFAAINISQFIVSLILLLALRFVGLRLRKNDQCAPAS